MYLLIKNIMVHFQINHKIIYISSANWRTFSAICSKVDIVNKYVYRYPFFEVNWFTPSNVGTCKSKLSIRSVQLLNIIIVNLY